MLKKPDSAQDIRILGEHVMNNSVGSTCGRGILAPLAVFLLALVLILPLADKTRAGDPDTTAAKSYDTSVYVGAITNPVNKKLTTFSEMMKLAYTNKQLKKYFQGKYDTTIFAPTNAAFKAFLATLTNKQKKQLLTPNSQLLQTLLAYHFVAGDWYLSEPGDLVGALSMASNSGANIYRSGNTTQISGSVIGKRFDFNNGVVHLIDKVIVPADGLFGPASLAAAHHHRGKPA